MNTSWTMSQCDDDSDATMKYTSDVLDIQCHRWIKHNAPCYWSIEALFIYFCFFILLFCIIIIFPWWPGALKVNPLKLHTFIKIHCSGCWRGKHLQIGFSASNLIDRKKYISTVWWQYWTCNQSINWIPIRVQHFPQSIGSNLHQHWSRPLTKTHSFFRAFRETILLKNQSIYDIRM